MHCIAKDFFIMSSQYFQYTFSIAEGQERDILLASLQDAGFDAFEEKADELLAFNEQDLSEVLNKNIPDYQFQKEILEQKNWNEEWEKNFLPVQVENFVQIRADFHKSLPDFQHEIIINPKMSFGTGHHATTYLMLQQMQQLGFKNKSVLDFGAGTGILSIMAEKLDAETITAIDNDEWSISNGAENIAANSCNKINIKQAEKPEGKEVFDVILANINKNVIIAHLPALVVALTKNGALLLSGLLENDEKDIREALDFYHFQAHNITKKDSWLCMLFYANTAML